MRGTGDWVSNQVPEAWDEFILWEYPNGMTPLYAMQSMYKKQAVDSYKFHWWTKTLPEQAITTTAGSTVYINSTLATAYVYATHQATYGIAGATIYVKVTLAYAQEVKPRHVILLRDASRLTVDVRGKVAAVTEDGADSYLTVTLLEADDNDATSATYNLATVDRVLTMGNVNPEGSTAPDAMGMDPVEYDNVTQIFRDTLSLTGTAQATKLRTGDAYLEAKKDCTELHALGIEKAGWWGIQTTNTVSGKQERTTEGLFSFINRTNPTNVIDSLTDADVAADSAWTAYGEDWLNKNLARLFRYCKGEAFFWCGEGAMLGIQKLAKANNYNLEVNEAAYGIKVVTWVTPFGTAHFKTHPLFSMEITNTYTMVGGKPANAKFCPLQGRDTKFETDLQIAGTDGKTDGFITEGGWKFLFPNQWMIFHNVGVDKPA